MKASVLFPFYFLAVCMGQYVCSKQHSCSLHRWSVRRIPLCIKNV